MFFKDFGIITDIVNPLAKIPSPALLKMRALSQPHKVVLHQGRPSTSEEGHVDDQTLQNTRTFHQNPSKKGKSRQTNYYHWVNNIVLIQQITVTLNRITSFIAIETITHIAVQIHYA